MERLRREKEKQGWQEQDRQDETMVFHEFRSV
jgi:hypothetical protein